MHWRDDRGAIERAVYERRSDAGTLSIIVQEDGGSYEDMRGEEYAEGKRTIV